MTRPAAADRRAFLQASLFGGSCLALGLRAARAEAAATGRPVFSEASFNQMMREAQTSGQIKRIAAEAGRDPKGWLARSFTLTPLQAQQIQSLPPATVSEISRALAPVAQKGGSVQIFLTNPPASKAAVAQKAQQATDQGGCRKFGLTARAIGGQEMTVAHTLPAVQAERQLTPAQGIQQQGAQTQGVQQQKVLEQKGR